PDGAIVRLGTTRFRHDSSIWGIAFAPDGKTVFSSSHDGTVRRWDVATGKEVRQARIGPRGFPHPLAVARPEDGRLIVATSDRHYEGASLHLWDGATGKSL